MLDIIYIALTLALFALVSLIVKGERPAARAARPPRRDVTGGGERE